jgi:hypothetical protein
VVELVDEAERIATQRSAAFVVERGRFPARDADRAFESALE